MPTNARRPRRSTTYKRRTSDVDRASTSYMSPHHAVVLFAAMAAAAAMSFTAFLASCKREGEAALAAHALAMMPAYGLDQSALPEAVL